MSNLQQPTCRLCGYQLKATSGCATCLPIKPNIVWPILRPESADTIATARALTQETATMLRRQVRRLRELENAQKSYDSNVTTQMVKLARPIKELAAEVRKLEDRDTNEYNTLSYEERIELFIRQFYLDLPEEHQRSLMQQMHDVNSTQSRSLLPSYAAADEAEIIPPDPLADE